MAVAGPEAAAEAAAVVVGEVAAVAEVAEVAEVRNDRETSQAAALVRGKGILLQTVALVGMKQGFSLP